MADNARIDGNLLEWALGALAAALAVSLRALSRGRSGHHKKQPDAPATSGPQPTLAELIGAMRIPDPWREDFQQIADLAAARRMEEHEDEVNAHVEHLRELSAAFENAMAASRVKGAEVDRRLAALESAASEFRQTAQSIASVVTDAMGKLPQVVISIIERDRRTRDQ